MKKIIKLLAAVFIIYFITAKTLPKLMSATTLENNSNPDVICTRHGRNF